MQCDCALDYNLIAIIDRDKLELEENFNLFALGNELFKGNYNNYIYV